MLETSLSQEEEVLGVVTETREEEFSKNKTVLEICRKRKRSEEEEEEEEGVVEEENDGFRTPTRPENRIPEPKECPPAPGRYRNEYSEMLLKAKTTTSLCRRRLNFVPEDVVNSFITDLQRRTTTTTIKIKK